jgi:hypothetical protein
MGLINDMIRSSTTSYGIGQFKFDVRDPESKYVLQQINRNQRRRWRKEGRVPKQVLTVLWSWDIKIESAPPTAGMALDRFLKLLWEFLRTCSEKEKETGGAALTLYLETVRSELMSIGKGRMNSKRPPLKLPL